MSSHRFVEKLPELIPPEEYSKDPDGRRVRLRVRVAEGNVEVLGDAARAATLEELLEALGGNNPIDQMLCG